MVFRRGSEVKGSEKTAAIIYLEKNIRIRLTDPDKKPVANGRCRIAETPDTIYQLDDKGIVIVPFTDTTKDEIRIQWESKDSSKSGGNGSFYWMGVFDAVHIDSANDEACRTRLDHLGFNGKTLEEQVKNYQSHFNREPTGNLAAIRDELIQWHDGGNYPGTSQKSVSDQKLNSWVSALNNAFNSGLFGGTDEDEIVRVLTEAQGQICTLESKYSQTYSGEMNLENELYDELSGEELKSILHLFYEFDKSKTYLPVVENPQWADKIHEAFNSSLFGMGTDEDQMMNVLIETQRKQQAGELSALYKQKYGSDLEDDLYDELSGDERKEALRLYYGGFKGNGRISGSSSNSESTPDGTLVPAGQTNRDLQVTVMDCKGTPLAACTVELLFGAVTLAGGVTSAGGMCNITAPNMTGTTLRITSIKEDTLSEGEGAGNTTAETVYDLQRGIDCPLLDSVIITVVKGKDLIIEYIHHPECEYTWSDDVCILWSSDDDGKTYYSEISLSESDSTQVEGSKHLIRFKNVIPNHPYSCFVNFGKEDGGIMVFSETFVANAPE
jgi:hypothetical protein